MLKSVNEWRRTENKIRVCVLNVKCLTGSSVSMFLSGLPQYLVSEAEDTDFSEGEEDCG